MVRIKNVINVQNIILLTGSPPPRVREGDSGS